MSEQEEQVSPAMLVPVTEAPLTFVMLQKIARTEFVPKALRGKPAAMVAAIKTGQELGIGPMTSMRAIDVIDGNPTPSAELLNAMIRKAGHELLPVEISAEKVTLIARRYDNRDDPREVTSTFEYTLTIEDMAKVTYYDKNRKQVRLIDKQVWQEYRPNMLWARAVSNIARIMFADVTLRLGYTVDERAPAEEVHPPGVTFDVDLVKGELPEPAVEVPDGEDEDRLLELRTLLGEPAGEGTMPIIKDRVKRINQLAIDEGIIPQGLYYQGLAARCEKLGIDTAPDGYFHVSSLRRDALVEFAEAFVTTVRKASAELFVIDEEPPDEGDANDEDEDDAFEGMVGDGY